MLYSTDVQKFNVLLQVSPYTYVCYYCDDFDQWWQNQRRLHVTVYNSHQRVYMYTTIVLW